MLIVYRRHLKQCSHRAEGRKHRHCPCPLWIDGFLYGEEIRRALGLRDWDRAQYLVRELEAEKPETASPEKESKPKKKSEPQAAEAESITVGEACERFLQAKRAQGLRETSFYKYTLLCRELQYFASQRGLRLLEELDLSRLDDFRASWRNRNISAGKKLERLRTLFRFLQQRKWIKDNPATELQKPIIKDRPTLPFDREEMTRIVAACDLYAERYPRAGQEQVQRLRALVLLLRYSGLRIQDAVTLSRDSIVDGKLFRYTQKTDVPVYCPLPKFVIEALEVTPQTNGKYFFWTGESKPKSAVGDWQRTLKKLFQLAGVHKGHAHRFRDTFAVELLLKDVPIEDVAILLGHKSVKTTEKHYAAFVDARRRRLEAHVRRTWEQNSEPASPDEGYAEGTRKRGG